MSGAALFDLARHHPDAPSVVHPEGRLTWGQVSERTARLANAFLELDLPQGARVAVLGHNGVDTLLTYTAAALAGVGAILVNFHLTPTEIEYLVSDGDAAAIWASTECLATARVVASASGIPLLSEARGSGPWPSLVNGAAAIPPAPELPTTSDLIYTSGTTGRPKGVEFPNLAATTVAERLDQMAHHHMAGLGTHLVAGPLYHAGPHGAVGLLLTGSPIVVAGRFDPDAVLAAIGEHRVATSVMVPTHLIRFLGLPEARRRAADTSSLRLLSVTGSACPVPVMRAMIEWFGPVFVETYGASESGILSRIESAEWASHPGSVGRVVAPFHPLVLDDDGTPCPPGTDGVLYFVDHTGRGIRYHNDPEKTAAAHVAPGTFTLGDVGHVDADGYLYITGRVTDMVISGGVNIYPAECERVLNDHPAVRDVALFGAPDEEMGERLVGLVTVLDETVSPADLIEYCRRSLAGYKVPRHLAVVPEIPRSPMGKVDKAAARQAYANLMGVTDS